MKAPTFTLVATLLPRASGSLPGFQAPGISSKPEAKEDTGWRGAPGEGSPNSS